MRLTNSLVAVIGLLATTGPLGAAPPLDCARASSTAEISFCAEIDLKRADAELNVVWRQALGAIDRQSQMDTATRAKWATALRASQRAWIAFRDADCGEPIGYEWYGGTGMSLAVLTCQMEKTRARSAELKQRYLDR